MSTITKSNTMTGQRYRRTILLAILAQCISVILMNYDAVAVNYLGLVLLVLSVAYPFYAVYARCIKLDLSPWLMLLLFIPFVGLGFMLYLAIVRSE